MKVDVANRVDRANRVWVKKGVILSELEKGWVNWVTGQIGLGRVDPYFFAQIKKKLFAIRLVM